MKVVVDVYEPKIFVDKLRMLGHEVVVSKLDAGDYQIDRCIFERKSVADFVQSMRGWSDRVGGRLFDQMDKLYTYAEGSGLVPFLMIHGDFGELRRQMERFGELNVSAVFGAIASVVVRYNINVVATVGEDEMLYVMLKIAEKVSEGKLGLPHRKSLRLVHPDRRIAHIANVLAVSPRVAEQLCRRFGGLRGILLAKDEELLSVPGIGPVILAKIRAILG